MTFQNRILNIAVTGALALLPFLSIYAASGAEPYKIVNTSQLMGSGGIDYVYADNDARRVYVPRAEQVLVFDEDTLKPVGSIPNVRARGAAVQAAVVVHPAPKP